jgi:DNA-binding IclR family transcriptional regulator
MTDDLVKRLREVGGMSDDGATRWYINPDGPEAADRIEKLEAALREIAALGYWDGDSAISIARKALEGKDD